MKNSKTLLKHEKHENMKNITNNIGDIEIGDIKKYLSNYEWTKRLLFRLSRKQHRVFKTSYNILDYDDLKRVSLLNVKITILRTLIK